MTNLKIRMIQVGIIVMFTLIICTIVSIRIEIWMLPQVKLTKPNTDELLNVSVPSACIVKDEFEQSYIFVVKKEEGVWGQELRVYQKQISILSEENQMAVINGTNNDSLVWYSNKTLQDGQRVKELTS